MSVRRTCFGTGHASGGVRLWFNGAAIDSGATRAAGSRVQSPVDETGMTYFLRTSGVLSQTAGTSNAYVDAQVNNSQACSAANPTGRAFTTLGTWTAAPVQSASQ